MKKIINTNRLLSLKSNYANRIYTINYYSKFNFSKDTESSSIKTQILNENNKDQNLFEIINDNHKPYIKVKKSKKLNKQQKEYIPSKEIDTLITEYNDEDFSHQDAQFKELCEFLLSTGTYTWDEYYNVNVILLQKISESTNKTQIEETKKEVDKIKKIVSTLHPDEKLKMYFKKTEQHDISKVSEVKIVDLNDIINKFQTYKQMHTYLHYLKQNGKKLPETMKHLNKELPRFETKELDEVNELYKNELYERLGVTEEKIEKIKSLKNQRKTENQKYRKTINHFYI